MDLENYEQYDMPEADFESLGQFLLEGTEVILGIFQGRMVNVELPMTVELMVSETAPAMKNATATAETKDAILETGLKIKVPPYLESGERVKVDTRDGRFISRA
jgi:elongation factor P